MKLSLRPTIDVTIIPGTVYQHRLFVHTVSLLVVERAIVIVVFVVFIPFYEGGVHCIDSVFPSNICTIYFGCFNRNIYIISTINAYVCVTFPIVSNKSTWIYNRATYSTCTVFILNIGCRVTTDKMTVRKAT